MAGFYPIKKKEKRKDRFGRIKGCFCPSYPVFEHLITEACSNPNIDAFPSTRAPGLTHQQRGCWGLFGSPHTHSSLLKTHTHAKHTHTNTQIPFKGHRCCCCCPLIGRRQTTNLVNFSPSSGDRLRTELCEAFAYVPPSAHADPARRTRGCLEIQERRLNQVGWSPVDLFTAGFRQKR